MSIFQHNNGQFFDQGKWEKSLSVTSDKALHNLSGLEAAGDSNQFILLQLTGDEKRILNTTQVVPTLKGESDKPDINMMLDFESLKIGSNENIDPDTKATLQLKVGQEQKITGLDKLFYCINAGLDLYDTVNKKKAEPKDFKKSTGEALANKPISLPAGTGMISLNIVKHEEPAWWQRVFSFAKSDKGQELLSLVGFPGITEAAVNCLAGMLDNLFDRAPEVLFKSIPIKVAFSQNAKSEMGSGLSNIYVSCLNPGYWVMAKKSDYDTIINAKPAYYMGYGILAPDGMSEIDALKDSQNNPFSRITYAVIRARMREVDLKQNVF